MKSAENGLKKIGANDREPDSPQRHCHPIAVRVGLPHNWEFWHKFDSEMLRCASEVWVLRLPGWETSAGVKAERAIAHELGIPIKEIDP